MSTELPPPYDSADLRRRAESSLNRAVDAHALSPADTVRLVHELQVHQIELELQNEELVAAQVRAETGLAQYTALYDFAPVAYATLSADGTIVQSNLACARLLGDRPAQLQGQYLQQFLDLAGRLSFGDWLQRVFDDGGPQSCQLNVSGLRAAGAPQRRQARVLRLDAERTPDEPTCLVVLIDLTPQLEAAAALQASQSRFLDTFEQAAVGIAHIAPDGRWLRINRKLCDIVGYSAAQLSRMTFQDITHPDDLDGDLHLVQRVLAGDINTYTLEKRYLRSDRRVVWIELTVALVRDASGAPDYFISVVIDIDVRRAAEAARDDAARQYIALFDANPSPMWIYDLDTRRVLGANHAAVVRYGYDREAFLKLNAEQLLDPAEATGLGSTQDTNVAGLKRAQLARHRAQDGSLFDVEVTTQAISFEGQAACVVLAHDVSEQRLAAQQAIEHRQALRLLLQRLQRAQEDERVRVAREVHDELGQMLTGLKMDLRWIERRLTEPGLLASQQPLLDRTVAASALVEQTIATVQELSAELRPGALDQLGLGAALAQRARQFQQRTGVQCTTVGADALPPLPAAMATELFYIAQEALTNVARHAQARQVEIRLRVQDAVVWLEIEDDGVGIGPAVLAAPEALGLLGMRERALLSGGTVQIDVVLPHGTCVRVRVPMAIPIEKAKAKAPR